MRYRINISVTPPGAGVGAKRQPRSILRRVFIFFGLLGCGALVCLRLTASAAGAAIFLAGRQEIYLPDEKQYGDDDHDYDYGCFRVGHGVYYSREPQPFSLIP